MSDAWNALSTGLQDALLALALLVPGALAGVLVLRGFRPWGLIRDMGRRFLWTNIVFVLLIAVAVGLGAGLLAAERGLRKGTAQAANRFDLIVSAPGSEITMLMATVYLQPADVPLLTGPQYAEVAATPEVALAAPLAYGDSAYGAPIVGTIADFVTDLSGELAEGRMFADHAEAVVGALSPFALGDEVEPAHGIGPAADHQAHEHTHYDVVGRMQPTGSPWDRAILVPVEAVWEAHGLANGHEPERGEQLGPPFDAAYFPGTPAIMVRAERLVANYALQSQFTRTDMMAFFPGGVLANLQARLGDVRAALSVMAGMTQLLVTVAVLAALMILVRLFARGLALLRALGAPGRFVFAVVWGYATVLLVAGAALGLALGVGAARIAAGIVTARTDVLVQIAPGWPEVHAVAAFLSLTLILALLPAWAAVLRSVLADLRA